MRSSTRVYKKERAMQFATWNPIEITGDTLQEEQNMVMYAEGVTERYGWIAPNERLEHEKVEVSEEQINIDTHRQQILDALIKRKKGDRNSPVFKGNEIEILSFNFPFFDLIKETPNVEEKLEEQLIIDSEMQAHQLEQANEQAQHIISEAKQQAEEHVIHLKSQAQSDVEQIVEQARTDAMSIVQQAHNSEASITQEAYDKGLQAARDQARIFLQTVQSVIDGLQKAHELVLARSEAEVINMLKTIAQNLFANGTALPEDVLKHSFTHALEEAKSLGSLRVRAHPEDVDILGGLWLEEQQRRSGITMEWVPSMDILRGGCVIEGEFGSLDARVDAKLARVLNKIDEIEQLPAEVIEVEDYAEDDYIHQVTRHEELAEDEMDIQINLGDEAVAKQRQFSDSSNDDLLDLSFSSEGQGEG